MTDGSSSTDQKVFRLFVQVAELSSKEQQRVLSARERDDPALVARVRDLLADGADGSSVPTWLAVHPTASPLLSAGDVVGSYRIRHRLGVGGMAEVWSAEHTQLGTLHAVKVLLRASEPLRARLIREGRAQARLRHPHIVPMHDILDLDGIPALVMPQINGPTLRAVLGEGPLREPDARAIFHAILSGVAHAHRCGFVHRDLKPANVLLDCREDQLIARVADFGLVKEISATAYTAGGMTMGTPAYAAPEQLRDAAAADPRADLFSLGVLLAEMLTGQRPFAGQTLNAITAAHAAPPQLDAVPPAYRALIADLLAVDPRQRPPSCAAVSARLPPVEDTVLRAGPLLTAAAARCPPLSTEQPAAAISDSSVPTPRDAFVGRRAELHALTDQLVDPQSRLVTLTGSGGEFELASVVMTPGISSRPTSDSGCTPHHLKRRVADTS